MDGDFSGFAESSHSDGLLSISADSAREILEPPGSELTLGNHVAEVRSGNPYDNRFI
jgi:hypothetical protein